MNSKNIVPPNSGPKMGKTTDEQPGMFLGESGQSARPRSTSLVSIQVWRAIAALLVVVTHASNELVSMGLGFRLIDNGPFGVDIFFVISGFVMVYSSERLFGQPGAPRKFFARRVARIVPAYWLATLLMVWFLLPRASTKAVIGSLLFSPHYPIEVPLLLVGWTLIFEMFFYAVFAVALLAGKRTAVIGCAAAFLAALAFLGPAPPSMPGFTVTSAKGLAYLADPIILEFALGMMLALLYRANIRLRFEATVLLLALGTGWLAMTVEWMPRPYSCGIAAALIVGGPALCSVPSPGPGNLVARIGVFLGDISYSLYLTHFLSFAYVAWIATQLAINPLDYVWPYVVAMLGAAVLIASVMYLCFEKPVTKFLQKQAEEQSWPTFPIRTGKRVLHPGET